MNIFRLHKILIAILSFLLTLLSIIYNKSGYIMSSVHFYEGKVYNTNNLTTSEKQMEGELKKMADRRTM